MSDVGAVLRVAYPKALSTLVRVVGSLDRAEDVLQDAAASALVRWDEDGVPDNPAAWLVRAARNRAIDGYRRSNLEKRHSASTIAAAPSVPIVPKVEEVGLQDDMLRLVFTCCHPVLTREAQVALTLKAVAGLSVPEIARAFLVPPRTIEQRITRAKRCIREAGVPYQVPSYREQPQRLASVLAVVYLIFNEGYAASSEAPMIRHELCRLAIGQAHLLYRLFPGEAEVEGLLALLLLSHSRAAARVSPAGAAVPLDRQDRKLWDRAAINEGLALLDRAERRGTRGPYQIQAAISGAHCRALGWRDTDWPRIVVLYEDLLLIAPSPVVRLNHAVALSRVAGPEAGLELVQAISDERSVAGQRSYDAVRAALFDELGRWGEALVAYRTTLARTKNVSEMRYLEGKIARVEKKLAAAVGKPSAGTSSM